VEGGSVTQSLQTEENPNDKTFGPIPRSIGPYHCAGPPPTRPHPSTHTCCCSSSATSPSPGGAHSTTHSTPPCVPSSLHLYALLLRIGAGVDVRLVVPLRHMVLVLPRMRYGVLLLNLFRLDLVVEKVLALEAAEPILHRLVRPTHRAEVVHIVRLVLEPLVRVLLTLLRAEPLAVPKGVGGLDFVVAAVEAEGDVVGHLCFLRLVCECNITYYWGDVKRPRHPARRWSQSTPASVPG